MLRCVRRGLTDAVSPVGMKFESRLAGAGVASLGVVAAVLTSSVLHGALVGIWGHSVDSQMREREREREGERETETETETERETHTHRHRERQRERERQRQRETHTHREQKGE